MTSRRSSTVLVWLAASLSMAPMGLSAAPEPPPLPPDSVDRLGLRWDLDAIGRKEATKGKPFRFSLCERRYLQPDEVSAPCNKPIDVNGGHNAPYVFSAGHGTFLPEGLGLDGNGVLHGDDPKLLSKVGELPLCVRQLHVERCKTVKLGPKTRWSPDPIAQSIGSVPGAPKRGMSTPTRILLASGTAVTAGAALLVADSMTTMNEDLDSGGRSSGCVTAADVVASAPGALIAYGPNTACTPSTSCGGSIGMAVCMDLKCDRAEYYYRTTDGKEFSCGAVVPTGASFTFNAGHCNAAAASVINYCVGR